MFKGSDNVNHSDDDGESCESSGNDYHNTEGDSAKTQVVAECPNHDETGQVDANKVSQHVGDLNSGNAC